MCALLLDLSLCRNLFLEGNRFHKKCFWDMLGDDSRKMSTINQLLVLADVSSIWKHWWFKHWICVYPILNCGSLDVVFDWIFEFRRRQVSFIDLSRRHTQLELWKKPNLILYTRNTHLWTLLWTDFATFVLPLISRKSLQNIIIWRT